MLVASVAKTCKVLPAMVACLLAVASLVCLVHSEAIADAQTAHHEHRHASTSSATHLTLDLHCLVAILPGTVVLVWFCLATLYLSVRLSKLVVLVFPPFIPPKSLTCA
jgi:uncharacterized membrane protein